MLPAFTQHHAMQNNDEKKQAQKCTGQSSLGVV